MGTISHDVAVELFKTTIFTRGLSRPSAFPTAPWYKSSPIPTSTINELDPWHCITTSTTSMTNNFESAITFFPEYTSASTATLRIREIIQSILETIRHRCAGRRPLNGLKSLPGQFSAPTTLCETTACLVFSHIAIASGDSAPMSR